MTEDPVGAERGWTMIRVLVVEVDANLRMTLEEAIHEQGYACVGVSDPDLARAALLLSPHALVVLVGHGGPHDLGTRLAAEASAMPRHAYIILSTRPSQAPQTHNPHTQRFIPVVSAPFDIDTLLANVEDAMQRLDPPLPAMCRASEVRLSALRHAAPRPHVHA